jgi:hypothetical protein
MATLSVSNNFGEEASRVRARITMSVHEKRQAGWSRLMGTWGREHGGSLEKPELAHWTEIARA